MISYCSSETELLGIDWKIFCWRSNNAYYSERWRHGFSPVIQWGKGGQTKVRIFFAMKYCCHKYISSFSRITIPAILLLRHFIRNRNFLHELVKLAVSSSKVCKYTVPKRSFNLDRNLFLVNSLKILLLWFLDEWNIFFPNKKRPWMNFLGLEASWGSAYFMHLRREMKLQKSWETGLQSQEMQSQ